MKIAIVTSSFYPVIDGVTVAVYNRLRYLSKSGHKVLVFAPDYGSLKEMYPNWQDYTGEILPKVTVISLASKPSLALDFERDVTSNSYKLVAAKLHEFQPDIIHVDEAERLSFCFLNKPGVRYAKKNQIPSVAFFHTNYLEYLDDYFRLPWKLLRPIKASLQKLFVNIYNSYDATLVSSRITYTKLSSLGIKNLCYGEFLGLDLGSYQKVESNINFWQKNYHTPDLNALVKLIFVGRLTPDKGWDFFLQGVKQLSPETMDKLAFIVVGDGEYKEKIQKQLGALTTHLYMLGRVSPKNIPSLLVNSDLFVTNSEKETRGLAVMEASAAGIPTIAPKAGGIVDTIVDGENGLLYQPQQIEDFVAKLNLLVSVRELRTAMGAKATDKVAELDWQCTTARLVRIWQQQIEQKSLCKPVTPKPFG